MQLYLATSIFGNMKVNPHSKAVEPFSLVALIVNAGVSFLNSYTNQSASAGEASRILNML